MGNTTNDLRALSASDLLGFWRLLNDGEMRQLGDEAYFTPSITGRGQWMPLSSCDLGLQNTNGHFTLPVRRWVKPNAPIQPPEGRAGHG